MVINPYRASIEFSSAIIASLLALRESKLSLCSLKCLTLVLNSSKSIKRLSNTVLNSLISFSKALSRFSMLIKGLAIVLDT